MRSRSAIGTPLAIAAALALSTLSLGCGQQAGQSGQQSGQAYQSGGGGETRVVVREERREEPRRADLPAGTPVTIELLTAVDSGTASVGQAVQGRVVSDVMADGYVAIAGGAEATGSVTEVKPAKHFGGQPSVSVRFDSVRLSSGDTVGLDGGVLTAAAKKQTGKDAGIIAGSAVGGAILGKVVGGDDSDAAAGAVVGGGIGTAVASKKGDEAYLPPGSRVTASTQSTATIRASS